MSHWLRAELDGKVNDVQARTRIKKLGKILDEVYHDHAKLAKGKTFLLVT